MTRKFWTDEELGLITDREDLTARELSAIMPGRTQVSIQKQRRDIFLGVNRGSPGWSAEEDETLRQWAGHASSERMSGMLPGRTRRAVCQRVQRLGLEGVKDSNLDNPYSVGTRTVLAKTCTGCGHLLPGERFALYQIKNRGKYYRQTRCLFCHRDYSARERYENPDVLVARKKKYESKGKKSTKSRDGVNALTRANATRSGYPYVEADFKILEDPSLSLLGKALRLERTYNAVSCATSKIGARSLAPLLTFRDDVKWTIDNPNLDNVDDITAMLKEEFAEAGVKFPVWDWDDEDLD